MQVVESVEWETGFVPGWDFQVTGVWRGNMRGD